MKKLRSIFFIIFHIHTTIFATKYPSPNNNKKLNHHIFVTKHPSEPNQPIINNCINQLFCHTHFLAAQNQQLAYMLTIYQKQTNELTELLQILAQQTLKQKIEQQKLFLLFQQQQQINADLIYSNKNENQRNK